jgi:hypothetical protein
MLRLREVLPHDVDRSGDFCVGSVELGEFFGIHPHLVGFGKMLLNVLLAFVAEEGDDRLQLGVGRPDLLGSDQVSPAARPDEEPVLLGQAAHALHGLLRVDGEGRVDQPSVTLEDTRHEAVGDPLYEVLPHLPAQYGRGLRGLHGKELGLGVNRAEGLPDPYEGAARPHAHNERLGAGSCRRYVVGKHLGGRNAATTLA